MICETCKREHFGTYGSGRFCDQKCAKKFSTLGNTERGLKISAALKGKKLPPRERPKVGPMTQKHKDAVSASLLLKNEIKLMSSDWDKVSKRGKYKRLLLEQNDQCALCLNPPLWLEKPLKFHIDHVNGDHSNNTRENLRLLCPNCHSQTSTWGSRNASPEGRERMIEALTRKKRNMKLLREQNYAEDSIVEGICRY